MEKFFKKYIDTIRIVIGILCFVAFILWGVFGSDKESIPSYEELEEEVDMLQQMVEFLSDENSDYEQQISEYEEELVLIVEGSEDFHSCFNYCDIVKNSSFEKEDINTYKIYYYWGADFEGYEGCPKCFKFEG